MQRWSSGPARGPTSSSCFRERFHMFFRLRTWNPPILMRLSSAKNTGNPMHVEQGLRLLPVTESVAVRQETLGALADRVTVPLYDRRRLGRSVVHFGVGGFHRAHQATYFDEIAQRGISSDWGITGVGLRSWQMGVVLRAQDCLYAMVERDASGTRGRVVGSIVDYIHGAAAPEHLLQV